MCDKQLFRQAEHGRFRDAGDIETISSAQPPRSAKELHDAAVALQEKQRKERRRNG